MYEQKTPAFLQTKSISFAQIFPYSHPKQPFFTLHFPFAPSHNLLSTKNPAILLQSALNPYAVTPERRTDSKPFRRCFVRKTGFGSCRRKFLQKYFRQSFESRSQDGVQLLETWSPCSRPFAILPVSAVSDAQKLATGNFLHVRACFLVTFCTTQKVTSRSPSQEASRFSKPRFSSPKQRFRTNKIKTFHQGRFEVFQTSNQRTQTQTSHTPLKSFAAPQLLRRLAATSFSTFCVTKSRAKKPGGA